MVKTHTSQAACLAVLPFETLAGSSEYDYLGTGFVEDLIVDLSHFPSLQIISSYTANRLGNNDEDIINAARQVAIDYLLKGSMRFSKDALRINTQLLDTANAGILWAERFDTDADSCFEIQDSIVERVVAAISSEVDNSLLAAARKKPLTSLEAYDCWLRGMDRLSLGTLEADHQAREFFKQALTIDPQYSRAYAGLSLSHFNEWSCQLWELYEQSEKSAYNYALKALQLNDTDHVVQMILGRVYLFRRQFDEAGHHIERSLKLNSNDADNLVQLATCMTYLGRAAEGERLFNKALKLNPYRNLWYYQYGSFTYFVQKKYQTSIEMALKRPLTNVWVDLPGYIAAAHAYLGTLDQAKHYLEMFVTCFQTSITKGRTPQAEEIINFVKRANPFKYQSDTDHIIDGLTLAGLEKHGTGSKVKNILSLPEKNIEAPSLFRKKQKMWHISYENIEITLTDMKGLHDIAALINAPDDQIHATELMGSESSMDENGFTIDTKAHQAYKQHIQDLKCDISEAEEMNDLGRKTKLQRELDQLIEHLSKAVGIGQRPRKLKSQSERARSAVTLRIKSAIKRISEQHPSLGKHFSNSIRTGVFCYYSPEEQRNWNLQ